MQNKKLKNIRLQIGLTQKQFGSKLKVSQGAVSQWERGLTYPCVNVAAKLVKLAMKFNINCSVEGLRDK